MEAWHGMAWHGMGNAEMGCGGWMGRGEIGWWSGEKGGKVMDGEDEIEERGMRNSQLGI